ncbi:methyl-accepting chemotaxis protein [Duganella sp. CF458]|uniref:methyl-accepting chemotaxis protein n=1 Tax=Duganella sp. CF458 TaxID=1884368 RepID=UPI0008E74A5E|nr:methyl-accepting chemotaxis protein [Duganella sp. CF458]SFG43235.1 methyl-accepting chemotaxis protein [Duganella sp. CF458]
MELLHRLSIRHKLLLSMGLTLLLFIIISSTLSIMKTSQAARERVLRQELPAQVAAIRNDVLRQIATPLAVSQTLANNTFLHAWEDAGVPDEGVEAWTTEAKNLKSKNNAATVFWVSRATGKYYTDKGYDRTLNEKAASDQWFYGFLSGSSAYQLDIDKDVSADTYMLFINTRVQTAGGKQAAAGLGLSVNALAEAVRNYKLGQSGYVFLVRANGAVLIHRDPKMVDGKHQLAELHGMTPALAKRLLGGEAFVADSFKGAEGEMLVASSFIPELNAYLVAQVPEAEVLAGIARGAAMTSLIAAIIGGGIGLLAIFAIARAIASPVAKAAELLEDIASGGGDLTRRMPVQSKDELGALAGAFNKFVESLNATILRVRDSSRAIGAATGDIASGNMDLSARTEGQASNLEQTAAAMEELTSTVHNNTANAEQANKLVAGTAESAKRGGDVVGQVVEKMASITASSNKISDIIGVIDGIAFQTNILALNAAVEAARAGEQGRGFAVVASEVRNLAQRSAAAAKEIKELITESVQQVADGGKLADSAGNAMQEILKSVQNVAGLMQEIASASQEQSLGIDQVNQAVTQMDNTTQQNAALVEEAAAAAQSLSEQAARLEEVVGLFKLDATPKLR